MHTRLIIAGLIVAVITAISIQVTTPTDHTSARYDMPELGMQPGAYNDMFNGDK